MRISLKQTILLGTALFTTNLSLQAMEDTVDNNKKPSVTSNVTDEQSVTPKEEKLSETIPAKEYSLFTALGIPTPKKESYEDKTFKQTLAILADEGAEETTDKLPNNTQSVDSLSILNQPVTNLDNLEEQFNAYKNQKITLPLHISTTKEDTAEPQNITDLSLVWRQPSVDLWNSIISTFNLAELNAPYEALFDDLYALVEPDSAQIAISRLDKANKTFGEIIQKRRNAAAELTKHKGNTQESSNIFSQNTQELLNLKIKEQNRFKRALFDFILTRELFFKLNEIKKTYQDIIDANTKTKSLIPTLTDGQQAAIQRANANIRYICQKILNIETFIKSVYPFSRSFLPTAVSKIAIGTRTTTKQKRFSVTGVDTLDDNIVMPLLFDTEQTYDGQKIDSNTVTLIKNYMEILLSDSYALQDAIVAKRIAYLTAHEAETKRLTLSTQVSSETISTGGDDGMISNKAEEIVTVEPGSAKDKAEGDIPPINATQKKEKKKNSKKPTDGNGNNNDVDNT